MPPPPRIFQTKGFLSKNYIIKILRDNVRTSLASSLFCMKTVCDSSAAELQHATNMADIEHQSFPENIVNSCSFINKYMTSYRWSLKAF